MTLWWVSIQDPHGDFAGGMVVEAQSQRQLQGLVEDAVLMVMPKATANAFPVLATDEHHFAEAPRNVVLDEEYCRKFLATKSVREWKQEAKKEWN